MAKRVRDAVFDSPTARAKLKVRTKPYFRAIDRGLHLGYRKGATGGTWVARRYLGDERYVVEALGRADDRLDADGATILTFHQAQDRARQRVRDVEEAARLAALGPALRVHDAVMAYVEAREVREAQSKGGIGVIRDSRSRLTKHVLADGILADKLLAALTADDLHIWRRRLASTLAEGTVRRTVNDFKAALNATIRRQGDKLPAAITATVRNGLAATSSSAPVAREAQILTDADIRRIVAASAEVDASGEWDGDLYRLIIVMAATGARFSQIQRMTIADVQPEQNRLMIPVSRKGKGAKHATHVAVRVTPDVVEAIRPALSGRRGPDPLLMRPRWRMVKVGVWQKDDRVRWQLASEMRQPWAAILQKAGLPADLVPYAMRHSSIVRGLRANLPVRLVAALHDTSTAMIEAHYSAFIVTALDELAALAAVSLVTPAPAQLWSVG